MKIEINRGDFVSLIIPVFCDDLSYIETGTIGRVTGITGRKVRVFFKNLKKVVNISIDALKKDELLSSRKNKLKIVLK